MANEIIIRLSDEDRALLTALREAIGSALGTNCGKCAEVVEGMCKACPDAHPVDAVPPATVEDVLPAAPAPAPVPDQTPAPAPVPEKKYTVGEVQKIVTDLCQKRPALKATVKDIMNRYARNVSSIPESKLAAFVADLEAL